MRLCASILAIPLCLLLAPPATATDMRERLDALLRGEFEGVALVARGDSILLHAAYGFHDRQSRLRMQPDSRFLVGSVTKSFTAALVLQQVEAGRIDLEASVCDYLPWYPEVPGRGLTIHRLLANTSGLPHYDGFEQLGYTYETFRDARFTPTQLAETIARMKLVHEPGARYTYSSPGYMLLGVVLEAVTKHSFAELLHNHIVVPLELPHTGYAGNSFVDDSLASDYRFERNSVLKSIATLSMGRWVEAPARDQSNTYSAGGIHSSALDLWRWSRALRSAPVVTPDLAQRMFTPNERGYCYGWFRNDEQILRRDTNVQLYSHGGEVGGYRAFLGIYDDATTIVLLSNGKSPNVLDLVRHLHLAATGQDRVHKDFLHPSLRNLASFEEEGGVPAFDYYHQELSRRAGYAIYPSASTLYRVVTMLLEDDRFADAVALVERQLAAQQPVPEDVGNLVGYAFLEAGHSEHSIVLFRRNVAAHPQSANTYDSLGEAYESISEFDAALENYRAAVDLASARGDANLGTYEKNVQRVENKLARAR